MSREDGPHWIDARAFRWRGALARNRRPHVIDPTGYIIEFDGPGSTATHSVADAAGLGRALGRSDGLERCYLEQWVHFGYGVDDSCCVLGALETGFHETDGTLADPLMVLARSEAVQSHHGEPNELDSSAVGVLADPPTVGTFPDQPGNPTPTTGEVQVTINDTTAWEQGYCVQVDVTNDGETEVAWSITLPLDGGITSLWNARRVGDERAARFEGVDWNAKRRPGSTTNFGFYAER
ncbi:MAG: cellulase/cellobiase CelA1 [Myxococcota bacterium]|jgi:cellulase/cellobiase CelA1